MYRFQWSVFLTEEFINSLRSMAQLDAGDSIEAALPVVAEIFSRTGGLEFTERPYDVEQRTAIANRLLHEAVKHSLSLAAPVDFAPGYVMSSSRGYDRVVTAIWKVPINSATQAELNALPQVTPEIARRIVEERAANGPFKTLEELRDRVKGIGKVAVLKLAHAIWLDTPERTLRQNLEIKDDLREDFSALLSQQRGQSKLEKLYNTLNMMAMHCAEEPHPAHQHLLMRDFFIPEVQVETQASSVGALFGYEYFLQLPGLLSAASASMEVCMFHIAFVTEHHPTKKLLDALVEANRRGVTVRVLVDQDRKEDPYESTIINSPAKEYLERSGVACKFDTRERLLHSKYVIIDGSLLIIGSHNWSAGSYFQLDDFSLAVYSKALAGQQLERFNAIWSAS